MKAKEAYKNRNYLLLSYFVTTFGFSLFVPLYAAFIVQLGQSPERASFLWAVYTLIFGLSTMIIGKLQDKIAKNSYKYILVLGYLLRLIATIVFIIAIKDYFIFSLGLIVYGIGSAVLTPSWFSVYARQANKHEALNFSLSEGGGALFTAAGAACGGLLFAVGGYDYIFYGMIIMHLIGLVASMKISNQD